MTRARVARRQNDDAGEAERRREELDARDALAGNELQEERHRERHHVHDERRVRRERRARTDDPGHEMRRQHEPRHDRAPQLSEAESRVAAPCAHEQRKQERRCGEQAKAREEYRSTALALMKITAVEQAKTPTSRRSAGTSADREFTRRAVYDASPCRSSTCRSPSSKRTAERTRSPATSTSTGSARSPRCAR